MPDVTFRLALIIKEMKNLVMEAIDIETAFLEGDMDTELYMKIPEGMKHFDEIADDDCLQLIKCIYGSVLAARHFWKKFVRCLEEFGFKQSPVDPCALIRQDKNGLVILCSYVDDVLMIGDQVAIDITKKDMDTVFTTKKSVDVTEMLSMNGVVR